MKVSALIICSLLLVFVLSSVQAQHIRVLQQKPGYSFRGLSVVNNHVAWVSGSRGTVVSTKDGGKTWNWMQVKGFEQSDFRDIEAFSDKEAIIMSSGTPALVLKTVDGGANWQVTYRNDDKAYFLDAMDFSPDGRHGFILGDPIANRPLLLETTDGGQTWNAMSNVPDASAGEASFAASGTCLQLDPVSHYPMIITGGPVARLLSFNGTTWLSTTLPLAHGKASQGGFSFAKAKDFIIAVGGDYAHKNDKDSVACIIPQRKGQATPYLIAQQPAGFQSCVIALGHNTYLSTGTPGSNISTNDGQSWQMIDVKSYNVSQKAKHGTWVLLAGDAGIISTFEN